MVDYVRSHERGRIWNPESIPTELKEQGRRWVIAKMTGSGKPPLYPRSPTAVDSGLTFGDVVKVFNDPELGFIDTKRVDDGDKIIVGFMMDPNDDFYFLDWDDVRDPTVGDESLPETVVEWIEAIGGYTEVSPSGTGLKTICRMGDNKQVVTEASGAGKMYLDHPPVGSSEDKPHLDVYTGGQYTSVTGNVISRLSHGGKPTELTDASPVLDSILEEAVSARDDSHDRISDTTAHSENGVAHIGHQSARKWKRNQKGGNNSSGWIDGEWIETDNPSMDQIIATGCALSDSFQELWRGNISRYSTVSEADAALVSKLWYYADDESLVDLAFRQSGLYAKRLRRQSSSDWDKSYPKWDENSYRQTTIEHGRDNDRHQGRYLDPKD